MRRELVFALLLFAVGLNCTDGGMLPLTTKDICLMLRSGYSVEAVQKDLAARHLTGACDAPAEKALREAGATFELIAAIKSGSFKISAEEEKVASKEMATQAQRRSVEAEESRKFNTLYQDQLKRTRAAAPPSATVQLAAPPSSVVLDLVKGDLVSWRNGGLNRYDDEPLGKVKLVAFYTAARWSTACNSFTPKLVEFYNRAIPQHPEMAVVFLSKDRSPGEMETFVREAKMPWPVMDFDKLQSKQKEQLKKYQGQGLPNLLLLDVSGKVVSDTYDGETFLGPEKVLKDLETLAARIPPTVATNR